jgi:hypothetical protein
MKVLYFLMRVSPLIDTELTVGAPGRVARSTHWIYSPWRAEFDNE